MPCVLRDFVPRDVFFQSRGGSLILYLEETTINLKWEPIVKKIGPHSFFKKRTSIIHYFLKERTTHYFAFSRILYIFKRERIIDVIF